MRLSMSLAVLIVSAVSFCVALRDRLLIDVQTTRHFSPALPPRLREIIPELVLRKVLLKGAIDALEADNGGYFKTDWSRVRWHEGVRSRCIDLHARNISVLSALDAIVLQGEANYDLVPATADNPDEITVAMHNSYAKYRHATATPPEGPGVLQSYNIGEILDVGAHKTPMALNLDWNDGGVGTQLAIALSNNQIDGIYPRLIGTNLVVSATPEGHQLMGRLLPPLLVEVAQLKAERLRRTRDMRPR